METMPCIIITDSVVLPDTSVHFNVTDRRGAEAARQGEGPEQTVFITNMRKPGGVLLTENVCQIGTICQIRYARRIPEGLRLSVKGISRAVLRGLSFSDALVLAEVDRCPMEMDEDEDRIDGMRQTLKMVWRSYIVEKLEPRKGTDVLAAVRAKGHDSNLYMMLDLLEPDYDRRRELLEADTYSRAYEIVSTAIMLETEAGKIRREIQEKVRIQVEKNQREYLLREQLRVIRKELGEDGPGAEADRYEQETEALDAPEEVKSTLKKEIARFRTLSGSNAEASVSRTYIETLLSMPWNKVTTDRTDLRTARRILDEDHYGLQDVKERVLEFLAVRILSGKGDAPILCLVGPPGTGKTSIARSVARALERKYIRISLGGVRDEAEIRGHRRTYIGAIPGRIAAGLQKAGVSNPLILLDEVDKVSSDYKGDVSSALLEVLDPEQNCRFADHYIAVPVDLSRALFICTANDARTIPRPLLDRMEVVEIGSYTDVEKKHIAREHLIERQMERNGLKSGSLRITPGALDRIIDQYTREAGVRQLERRLGEICRKAAREILENQAGEAVVRADNLKTYLGKPPYPGNRKETMRDETGIACGLAWTAVGGTTLRIEVNVMPGKGELLLTGSLGDVMRESARTALSYIRSQASCWNVEPSWFPEHDIHLHIPEGAVPKDGPSAGITMTLAMLSAITGKKVRAGAAMTGEITLRGHVLPVGGLKEKLLAARKAGMSLVLVPEDNRADVEMLSGEITGKMDIRYVREMQEVQECLLL